MPTFTATAACPYEDAERAASALGGALRLQVPVNEVVGRATLEVSGPFEVPDGRGRMWFGYEAAVATR